MQNLRLLLLVTFLITSLTTLTTATDDTRIHHVHKNYHNNNTNTNNSLRVAQAACEGTIHHDLCITTLAKISDLGAKSFPRIISATVHVAVSDVKNSEAIFSDHISRNSASTAKDGAVEDCLELFSYTSENLREVISGLEESPAERYTDLQTLLSAAMTYQSTCLDGLANSGEGALVIEPVGQASRHVSNALHMLKKIKEEKKRRQQWDDDVFPVPEHGEMKDGFPKWMSKEDKALLRTKVHKIKADVVVAKDGSGDYKTIKEAIKSAPDKSSSRFVIYIKGGTYYEYVEVDQKKTMIMLVGDGIDETRIRGNRNVKDGWSTFKSATLTVVGKKFIAKGITVENYSGPEKNQAVAMRSDSDYSAFYECSFLGYQDTLYAHSLRQFYRDCDIYGTVDFIFGNAAVVFQKCNLYARRPIKSQKNVFTAQGREDPDQNTGISILNCKVAADKDLLSSEYSAKSFLGRPWKKYSRTVVMLSNIGSLIDPKGWLEWDGDFALKTLYYGEYKNTGSGSDIEDRVTWPGYKVIKSSSEARWFTAGKFIDGGDWLPDTKVPHYLGLSDDD